MTCIFCQIIDRKLPAEILYEDADVVVFRDVNPSAPIHLLIVPKKHFDSVNSLNEKNVGIYAQMVLIAKDLAAQLGTQSGFRLVTNTGREAGQVIHHLHMHLMGGWGRRP